MTDLHHFIALSDTHGAPCYVRPEQVSALRAIVIRNPHSGAPVEGTLVVLENRECIRCQGDAGKIAEHVEHTLATRRSSAHRQPSVLATAIKLATATSAPEAVDQPENQRPGRYFKMIRAVRQYAAKAETSFDRHYLLRAADVLASLDSLDAPEAVDHPEYQH